MTERIRGRPPALLLVAHGSRDPRAAATVEELAGRVRASRSGVEVAVAYLQHARPAVREALSTAYDRGHREVVVVPLLLTAAYHSTIDLPRQLADDGRVVVLPASTVSPASTVPPARSGHAVPGPSGHAGQAPSAVAAAPIKLAVRIAPVLGPDPALRAALERRVHEAGVARGDPRWGLVVAAAGSTDRQAAASVVALAAQLHRRGWGPVVVGFAAAAEPGVPEAVLRLRRHGASRVAVASYLLTPGRFSEALRCAGADAVSAPLAGTPEVAGLVLRRYDAAVGVQRR